MNQESNFRFTAIIRVDSGQHIGNGHVFRCLSIAAVLSQIGFKCYFICRQHIGHIAELISDQFVVLHLTEPKNYQYSSNDVPHSNWLGVSQEEDARETQELLDQEKISPDLVIIDHFSLSKVWERHITSYFDCFALVIDGLMDRSHDCHLLLDPTLVEKKGGLPQAYKYFFHGPKNIPLRREFYTYKKRIRHHVNEILVFFGGVDEINMTSSVIRVLQKNEYSGMIKKVNILVGQACPHIDEITSLLKSDVYNLEIQSNNVSQLMYQSDLAIGSGGISTWERCMMGLPSITVSIATNQIDQNKLMNEMGVSVYAGFYEDFHIMDRIEENFSRILNATSELKKMSEASYEVFPQELTNLPWINIIQEALVK